ncbi:MAG: HesA/MoeB/ThiF family protein [Bacteroidales bacterium]|nr:HesA/MoeB/ThiF family protein [Bacteroidales bacterium]
MILSEIEKARYSRHLLLQEVGERGVLNLRRAKVLVIGTGGLGSPVLSYLAAAGIGKIGIVDGDVVDISNLQRQILHYTDNIGTEKVVSAAQKIQRLNPEVELETYNCFLTEKNGEEIIASYDYILECTDNYNSKFLVNDLCVRLQKPFTHGSVLRFEGQCMTYVPGSACYRCLYPTSPDDGAVRSAAEVGVLGSVAGTIGTIQATEAIKYLSGINSLLTDRILLFDGLTMTFRTLRITKDPGCPLSHIK